MFCPLKMGHFIVESVIKPWNRKTISRGTLSQSTFLMFSHTNAQTVPQCLVLEGRWRSTGKIIIPKNNCSQTWHEINHKLSKFTSLFIYLWSYSLIDLGYITTPQDLDQYVLSSEDGSFYCGICSQAMKKKDNLKRHIESKHFPNIFSYQCPDCFTVLGTRKALERHRENSHAKR